MKNPYAITMFVLLLIPKLITSSDDDQPPAPPSSPLVVRARQLTRSSSLESEPASPHPPAHSPIILRARQLAAESAPESPHVVFTKDWMPYPLDFRPKTPPAESEEDSKLKIVQRIQRCRRLKVVDRALNPQSSTNGVARRSGLLQSADHDDDEFEEDEGTKRKIAIATAVGVSAVALPTGSAVALLVKNRSMARQAETRDIAEILNSGTGAVSGEWIPSSVKTGLGVGCGILAIVGVVWGGIALKNKFLEMHRKYQVARRSNALGNRQIQEQLETLRKAVLDQNKVLKPVVVQQAQFQDRVASEIAALQNGNNKVVHCIVGEDGLTEKLTTCEEAFNDAQDAVTELDTRVTLLEGQVGIEEAASAASSKPKSKFKWPHEKHRR